MAETRTTEATPLDIPQHVYNGLHPNIKELCKIVGQALKDQQQQSMLGDMKAMHDRIGNLSAEEKQGEAYKVAKELLHGVNALLGQNRKLKDLHRTLASAYLQEVLKDAGSKEQIVRDMFRRDNFRHFAGSEPVRLAPDMHGHQHFIRGGADQRARSALYADFLRAKKADLQAGSSAHVEQLQRDLKLDQNTIDRLNCEVAPLFTSFLGS